MSDNNSLTRLFESDFFTKSTWKCKTTLVIHGLHWKVGKDNITGKDIMYPIFKMRSIGSIGMKKFEYVQPEGVVPLEQRLAIMNASLFDGLDAPPSKKRKRTSASVKKVYTDTISSPSVPLSHSIGTQTDEAEIEGED